MGLYLLCMISYPSICVLYCWQYTYAVDIDGIWYLRSTITEVVRAGVLTTVSSDATLWFESSATPTERILQSFRCEI
jgi:hypothetical protein